jgi:site-specific DNA-cytosine methylase
MAKPTAIGVYIFAGGFTLGVEKHFQILAHFEDDGYGASSFAAARPKVPIYIGPDGWPWDEYAGVDFLYGNPPCAAWSPLGPRIQRGEDAWKTDVRVDCAKAQFNLLELMQPKVWAWESVPQAFSRGRPLVDYFTRRAHALGYDVSYVLHNAMHLGAFQHRKRFFFVAHRMSIRWQPLWLEAPTASAAIAATPRTDVNQENCEYYPTSILRRIPAGDPVRPWIEKIIEEKLAAAKKRGIKPENVKLPGRASFGVRRCPDDRVCGAVIGDSMIHPTEHRFLTVAEQLHLCGFPVDYPLQGNRDQKTKLLGRGVMPPVARWLAGNVARALKDDTPLGGKRRTFKVDFYKPPGTITDLVNQETWHA